MLGSPESSGYPACRKQYLVGVYLLKARPGLENAEAARQDDVLAEKRTILKPESGIHANTLLDSTLKQKRL